MRPPSGRIRRAGTRGRSWLACSIAFLLALAGCVETEPETQQEQPSPTPTTAESAAAQPPPQETSGSPSASASPEPSPEPGDNESGPGPPGAPSQRDWGSPSGKTLRPGVDVVGGGQCTTNFLFHLDDERYFLGAAAHCFLNGDSPFYASCPTPGVQSPGAGATFYDTNNAPVKGTLAYSSFHTMDRVGEKNAAVCLANDFALVEVPASAVAGLHPAVLAWGGPTALAPTEPVLARGDSLYAYGNSDVRPTYLLNGEGFPAEGPFNRYTADGWGIHGGPMTPPLVPGDSGGPVMDAQGRAHGALSVLETTTGDVRWTNVARALDYMAEHEGWAPSLVTWDNFER